ncbi:MAG: Nramp family divalent metal transporter [Streptococcaceae bacterium]|jgi:manganese transport protein|nr:Nramp family divalent metal transporter [Streptococcaceae bacterium]
MKRKDKMIHYKNETSLEDINSTVAIPKNVGFWKTLFAFSGPGALVAVGYMDPGNWITSIKGGFEFKYKLLTVILISSLIAMLLQSMASKLGIITKMDLAQATREYTGKKLGIVLWIITELAIMATDIAEVIGSAVALKLLFKIPLFLGVVITIFDVMLLLVLTKLGFRKIEALVITLIAVILLVFAYEVLVSRPSWSEVFAGFCPHSQLVTNPSMLTLSLGIIGATVMPHNLYLHSAISQTRKVDRNNLKDLRKAVHFANIDSNIQLTGAFIINSLLLILGASMFFGHTQALGGEEFINLYHALSDSKIVGNIASPILSTLFAVALLASGQNSTITGTLTGEIIMEGFIRLKFPLWIRRIITRGFAVLPVLICVILYGGKESAVEDLLLYSQVFLCIALPISMFPLIIFTSSKKLMGEFANHKWVSFIAWISAIILTILNLQLIWETGKKFFGR